MGARLGCLLLLLVAGCTGHRALRVYGVATGPKLDRLLAESPLSPDENILATPLGRAAHSSVHLVQIRDGETPHVHTRYDLAVTVLRGHGTLRLGGVAFPMGPGDAAFIPQGVPHQFINDGDDPAAALVVFAPPFDGADQVPVAADPFPVPPAAP
jgi:quercetin dioxygenase-like cupin family protein